MSSYRFTNQLPQGTCRICGQSFSKNWPDGGVGAICKDCYELRYQIDLVKEGLVRNIKPIKTKDNTASFTFEAKIDDVWYRCTYPYLNWACVKGYHKTHMIFSVPVGYWELKQLYAKHGAAQS